jgi:hypothetical protein
MGLTYHTGERPSFLVAWWKQERVRARALPAVDYPPLYRAACTNMQHDGWWHWERTYERVRQLQGAT